MPAYSDVDPILLFLSRPPERRGRGGIDGPPLTTAWAKYGVPGGTRLLREGIWAKVRIPKGGR